MKGLGHPEPSPNRARQAPGGADSVQVEAIWMIRLALGMPEAEAKPRWSLLFEMAVRERVAALAWLRSGPLIRRLAPPAVVSLWRAAVVGAEARTRDQLAVSASLVGRFQEGGVRAVVLKGPPLSARLYVEPWARASSDIDIFVPLAHRGQSHMILSSAGWHLHPGSGPPTDDTYSIVSANGSFSCVEIHSSVAGTLAQVRLDDFPASNMSVGGYLLPVHSGSTLPAFLAAHLTKHWMTVEVPLLYFVDLGALRSQLGESEWEDARVAAMDAGVLRALEWGLAHSAKIPLAAEGDTDALAALGLISGGARKSALRSVIEVADTRSDAARIFARWAIPLPLRRRPAAVARLLLDRAVHAGRRVTALAFPSRSGEAVRAPLRALELNADELAGITRLVVAEGRSLWMRARGISMVPAIPSGSLIRLGPVSDSLLTHGSVVLAELSHGQVVLHRIRQRDGTRLTLKGDNVSHDDPPVDIERVIAVAEVMSTRTGRAGPIPPVARGPRRVALKALRRLQRYVRWRI